MLTTGETALAICSIPNVAWKLNDTRGSISVDSPFSPGITFTGFLREKGVGTVEKESLDGVELLLHLLIMAGRLQ